MIFCSKNENGELAWRLIHEGWKRVTRRLKPIEVGKILAVQQGCGKKAVGYIQVISCNNSLSFIKNVDIRYLVRHKQTEAELEGFESWDGLMRWFEMHNINFMDTFRIEFVYLGEKKP